LSAIVNHLAILYDDIEALDEHKDAVDNFTRTAGESIAKCMTRAEKLVERLAPLYPMAAWPTQRLSLLKQILVQVIDEDVRFQLELEEQRCLSAGTIYDFQAAIETVRQYEKRKNGGPKKDRGLAFLVASGIPRITQHDMDSARGQLMHCKQIIEANASRIKYPEPKNWEHKTRKVDPKHYPERSRSNSTTRFQFGTPAPEPPTTSSYTNSNSEKPKTTYAPKIQPPRGRSFERRRYPSGNNSQQNNNQSNRPSQPSTQNKLPFRPYSPGRPQNGNRRSNSLPKLFKPVMRTIGDKHYYDCIACSVTHIWEEGQPYCSAYEGFYDKIAAYEAHLSATQPENE
jgi:hypothetical protein